MGIMGLSLVFSSSGFDYKDRLFRDGNKLMSECHLILFSFFFFTVFTHSTIGLGYYIDDLVYVC